MQSKYGFTLAEVLITLAVIGVVAAMMLPALVNNQKKKPNRWGHDVFTFQIIQDGKLLPIGHPQSDYPEEEGWCSLTSINAYNGVVCTYKALTDKNYFKNLPRQNNV